MDVPLYNTLAYFGSGYLISELCPACLTGISGCFFSLVFLFACFSFFCSLWLAFQVLPGPCNLHRPGGIPRIALGKGRKKKSSVGRRVAIVLSFRERGAPSTHRHHGPELVSSHIHIFTTPAVRVQHKVTVHIIVKTSV